MGSRKRENLSPLGSNSPSPLPKSYPEFYLLSPLKASFLSHGGLGILAQGLPCAKDTHTLFYLEIKPSGWPPSPRTRQDDPARTLLAYGQVSAEE